MEKSRKLRAVTSSRSFVGTWSSSDDYGSQVELTITRHRRGYLVSATDTSDGEMADIFQIVSDGDALTFAAHWNSNGRFARYRVAQLSAGHIEVTYTYTDQETYRRKRASRARTPKHGHSS